MPKGRGRGEAAAWAGIAGNVALAAAKIVVGLWGASQALLADGLHALADAVGSVIVLVGVRVASTPADADHPYGHEKAESVAALLVAVLLSLAGVEVGFSSLRGLFSGAVRVPAASALWVAAGSVLVKGGLYRYSDLVGKRVGSEAIKVGAREHQAAAVASLAALVGIAGARLGFPRLDPGAGALVSVFIIRWGWELAASAVQDLLDARGDPQLIEVISQEAALVAGVGEIQVVKTRRMGNLILVDMEIGLDGRTPLADAHDIAERVRLRLQESVPAVKDVMVHINPLPFAPDGEPAELAEPIEEGK